MSFAALCVCGASEVRCFVAALFCLFCVFPDARLLKDVVLPRVHARLLLAALLGDVFLRDSFAPRRLGYRFLCASASYVTFSGP